MIVVINSAVGNLRWRCGEVISRDNSVCTIRLIHIDGQTTHDEVEIPTEDIMEIPEFEQLAGNLMEEARSHREAAQFTEA